MIVAPQKNFDFRYAIDIPPPMIIRTAKRVSVVANLSSWCCDIVVCEGLQQLK